jgi:Caspase recruitment domain
MWSLSCRWLKRKSLAKKRKGSSGDHETDDTANISTNEDSPRELGGQLSEIIENLRTYLLKFMSLDDGLLRELRTLGIITPEQANDIRSKPSRDSAVNQLLTVVAGVSDTKQEQFLVALSNDQQTHVSAYMRANGNLFHIYRTLWPLYLCDEFRLIQEEWNKLIELIDCKCGLLDELFSTGFISDRQMKLIEAQQTDDEQNKQLLRILDYKTYGDFRQFLHSLEITNQSLVVSLLSDSDTYGEEPLNDETKSSLRSNHAKLVELIDTKHNRFLVELFACRCISLRQKQYIESADSQAKINRRLLDILRRGSENDLSKFIYSLKKTGQEHVANVLLEDGVVAHIVAKTNCSAAKKTCIQKNFMTFFDRIPSAHREQVYQFINLFSECPNAVRLLNQVTEQ